MNKTMPFSKCNTLRGKITIQQVYICDISFTQFVICVMCERRERLGRTASYARRPQLVRVAYYFNAYYIKEKIVVAGGMIPRTALTRNCPIVQELWCPEKAVRAAANFQGAKVDPVDVPLLDENCTDEEAQQVEPSKDTSRIAPIHRCGPSAEKLLYLGTENTPRM